jgi:cytochrome P450
MTAAPAKEIKLSGFAETGEALRNPNLMQAMYDEGAVIMKDVLLTLHGDEHRKRRMLEFRVFRRDFFRYYETQVFPATLDETIAPVLATGRADLIDLGYRVTMNLTADFAGIDRPRRTEDETRELLALVQVFGEGATLVHSTRDKEEVRREVRAAMEVFDTRFLQPSIARRQAMIARMQAGELREEELPRDVLTVLLLNEDRLELPPDLLRREVAFYLQAGAHSTANSTVHAVHEIMTWCCAHPEDAARVRRDPLFFQRCVHESLRLHPASPTAWRRATCPFAMDDGRTVDENDRVVIDMAAANRDKSVFGPNADVFDPHRVFAPGQMPFGLTFGSGLHACLGRDLDGGVVAREDTDPATHQYGIITLFARRILAEGARLDPSDPPTAATYTARPNWGRYPVIFDKDLKWQP